MKRHGFTLVELLVVVAVLTILISLLMPALKSSLRTARTAVCMNNEKQQGLALHMYTRDSRMYPPYGQDFTGGGMWFNRLINDGYISGNYGNGLFRCPNATWPERGYTHYSALEAAMRQYRTSYPRYHKKVTQYANPSQLIWVMDGTQRNQSDGYSNAVALILWNPGNCSSWWGESYTKDSPIPPRSNIDGLGSNSESDGRIRWRELDHRFGTDVPMGANFLYADGHIALERPGDILFKNIMP